jgi:hypothetical protein
MMKWRRLVPSLLTANVEEDVLTACAGCLGYNLYLHSQRNLVGLLSRGEHSHGTRSSCHPHETVRISLEHEFSATYGSDWLFADY